MKSNFASTESGGVKIRYGSSCTMHLRAAVLILIPGGERTREGSSVYNEQ